MRKLAAFLVAMVLMCGTAMAEEIDLSSMSYDELVALKDQINLAMWKCEEWQEVTVPQGVWKVGEDIPAGHWTIKTDNIFNSLVSCGTALSESGKGIDPFKSQCYYVDSIKSNESEFFEAARDKAETDIELENGMYIVVECGSVIFTPYSGKPSLGFK